MGIRFLCPQGHIINVKDFLAGKKGVCPDCGAKVRIPEASTHRKDGTPIEKSGAAEPVRLAATLPADPTPSVPNLLADASPATPTTAFVAAASAVPRAPVTLTPTGTIPMGSPAIPSGVPVAAAAPMGMPVTAAPVRAMPVTAVPLAGAAPFAAPVAAVPMGGMPPGAHAAPVAAYPMGGGMAAPAVIGGMRPPLQPGGPMPPGLMDPISEAPHATWYIRPGAGGQYGPARGEVMRQWLQEGRLAADSLVWRDGWPEWKNAALIFPQLAEGPAAAPQELIKTESSSQTAARYSARKQSGNSMGIAMIVLLGLICVGLLIALVVLLPKMK